MADFRVKEYGLSVEVTTAMAEEHALDPMVRRVREARDEALELGALQVFDPERYRQVMVARDAARRAAMTWTEMIHEHWRASRERLALAIAPWLEYE